MDRRFLFITKFEKSSNKSSREVGGRVWEALTTPRIFSLKTGVEQSKIVQSPVWYSRPWLPTGVHQAPCHDEFRGPGSDAVEIKWHKKQQ
ncbi:hypothetical protein TNCV_1443701 [Trichonephila clavipes]|nr:hypothetical protein TNCV_1443701 [Trichonephila clavipes]